MADFKLFRTAVPCIPSVHLSTERDWRGGEQQTLSLVAGLRSRGHPATLVASPRSELFARARDTGLEPVGIHAFNEVDPQAIVRMALLLRRCRPAVLHLHTPHAHLLGILAAAIAPPVRRVVSRRVEFSIYRHSFLGLNGIKYRHGVDRFVAVSRAVAAILERDGVPREKIAVVPSGVDPARFDPPPAPDADALLLELGLPRSLPVVASVGALAGQKGHRYLIEAAPAVLARRDAAFLIAGDGRLRSSLARLARARGVSGRLRLLGFRSDIGRILASSSVFVFPSLEEGLGTSLLDALLLGRPVVASRTGGIGEVVRDGEDGILVPPRDPEALASAILAVLAGADVWAGRAAAARRRVLDEFSVDRMVEGTLAVYRELAAPPSCRPASSRYDDGI
jgi:glycosyltransferase involved in cell wall biosynthesis